MTDTDSFGRAPEGTPDPANVSPDLGNHPLDPGHTNRSVMDQLDVELVEAMNTMTGHAPSGVTADIVVQPETLERGQELVGSVVGMNDDEVFLEFGAKCQGVMPRNQFGKKEPLEIGRKVDVVVERYDVEAALLTVSRKGASQRATWTNLSVGMIVEGRVTGVIKGGLELNINGIRAFMPGSQADVVPMKDVSVLLNQTIRCEVMELDRRHKNVLLSRRRLLEKEMKEQKEQLRQELQVGQVRKGVVRSITDFGAFVDLGGLDGLVHISDISYSNVEKVTDVLSEGQNVEVKVLKIDTERDRISLGLKQLQPDPWHDVAERFPEGTKAKVRVVRLAKFGAFAELAPGVEALIPLSEMGWSRINRPEEVVHAGDVIDAVVLRVEPKKRRLALSLKQAQADPWAGVLESFPANSVITGKVTRLADFGAFVELAPGVEGLVHISEISEQRIRSCADALQSGQEVQARVLGVDTEQRRISLSIKQVNAPADSAAAEHVPAEPAKPPKKRKKALRGGLASHFDWHQ